MRRRQFGRIAKGAGLKATTFDIPTIRSKPPREKQYDEDDHNDFDHTDAADYHSHTRSHQIDR